jgi:hypothetical protein
VRKSNNDPPAVKRGHLRMCSLSGLLANVFTVSYVGGQDYGLLAHPTEGQPKASFSVMQTLLWAPCHIAGNGPSGAAELRGGVSRWAHQGRWLRRARSVREATGNRRPGLARAGSKRHSRSAFTTKLAGWRHARSTFAS